MRRNSGHRARIGGKGKASENSHMTTPGRKRTRRADSVKTRARTLTDVFNVPSNNQASVPLNDDCQPQSEAALVPSTCSTSDSEKDEVSLRSPLNKRSRRGSDHKENSSETPSTTDASQGTEKNSESDECPGNLVMAARLSIKQASKGPSSRWGHTLSLINSSEAVLIGGQGDKQHICKDSVWHLDLARGQWKPAEIMTESGPKPELRMGHTATYDAMLRCIYLFGGSKNLKWFNDIHILDLDQWKWQVVKADGRAPTRAYHSASLYRHELWIFGGVFPQPMSQPDGCSNDIHVFSPIEKGWYNPIVLGEKPVPKSGHSATLLGDQLVVFGGWDAPVSYNDLQLLDLVLLEWTKPETNGRPPSPRSWHASCGLSGQRILIHGGYSGNDALNDSFIFNLETKAWTCVKLDSSVSARTGHVSVCLPYRHENEQNDEVLIFGGGDNEGLFFHDLIELMIPFEDKSSIDVAL